MPERTIAAAEHLANSLDVNTEELREVRSELKKVKTRSHVLAGSIIVTFVLLVVTIYSRYDQRVTSCEQDNELRSGMLSVAEELESQGSGLRLTEVPGYQNLTPELQSYLSALESASTPNPNAPTIADTLRDNFAVRNCDDIRWL